MPEEVEPVLRTADEWSQIKGIRVRDPDGWRNENLSWGALVNEANFDRLAAASTVDHGQQPERGPGRDGRPHWLPEQAWLGKVVGQWALQAFSGQQQAEAWAAQATWQPAMQRYEPRRIWAVDIPADTPTFAVETVPASTRLIEDRT